MLFWYIYVTIYSVFKWPTITNATITFLISSSMCRAKNLQCRTWQADGITRDNARKGSFVTKIALLTLLADQKKSFRWAIDEDWPRNNHIDACSIMSLANTPIYRNMILFRFSRRSTLAWSRFDLPREHLTYENRLCCSKCKCNWMGIFWLFTNMTTDNKRIYVIHCSRLSK